MGWIGWDTANDSFVTVSRCLSSRLFAASGLELRWTSTSEKHRFLHLHVFWSGWRKSGFPLRDSERPQDIWALGNHAVPYNRNKAKRDCRGSADADKTVQPYHKKPRLSMKVHRGSVFLAPLLHRRRFSAQYREVHRTHICNHPKVVTNKFTWPKLSRCENDYEYNTWSYLP